MKIQALTILACAATLFAQETSAPAAAPAQEALISCQAAFNTVKAAYPKDAATNRSYAMVEARIKVLKEVPAEKRNNANYLAEMKNCELSVEVFKVQQSMATLRKSLDSLTEKKFSAQREIFAVKDSLIELWTSDAKGAKSLNTALSAERSRLEKLSRETALKDSIEKARLAEEKARMEAELVKKEKALAEKDSLLAKQKAEAEKKLEALRSKTINVYKDARGTILSMSDILFETGKADLKQELKLNLAEIAAILKSLLNDSNIEVEGHTDDRGSDELNQKLSEHRALAVMNYLVERGVDKGKLKSVGYGKSRPVADNATDEGKAKNRRVELIIKD